MTHYKSNLRDLEFNLFEVFGADQAFGQGPYADIDVDTARSILAEVDRLAREDLAASYADGDRNPPVFDPATHTAPLPAAFQQVVPGVHGLRVLAPRPARPSSAARCAPRALWWALAELVLGSNAPIWMYASGPSFAHVAARRGHRRSRRSGPSSSSTSSGARRWCSPSRTPARTSAPAAPGRSRSPTAPGTSRASSASSPRGEHDLTDNIIHYVLARPVGVEGVGGPGTKGLSLFVVPKFHFDARDRRAGRAQRRLRHQRRAQDGPQGLQHLRADLRRARRPGQGLAARRRARGHPADVPDHRVRPDDGRHEGDRHPVHRLPQRAGVRQEPGPGRRPAADDRQGRAAGHDHPPPRRAPLAAAAEVVRRGPARAGRLHRAPGRTRSQHRRGRRRRRKAAKLAERVNDLLLPLVKGCRLGAGVRAARPRVAADLRRLRLPAGLPARAVRPRREDRHPVRGHDRDPEPRPDLPQDREGQRPGARWRSPARSRRSSTPRPATASSRRSGSRSARRSATCRACWHR